LRLRRDEHRFEAAIGRRFDQDDPTAGPIAFEARLDAATHHAVLRRVPDP
jgi:hypothetical protein